MNAKNAELKNLNVMYGKGGCPVLGGDACEVDFRNCPCQNFEECYAEGRVPVCVCCSRKNHCQLGYTQSCSLFENVEYDYIFVGAVKRC